MSISPCTVNIGVVNGPDVKLREKNISRQESQRRLHAHEIEIKNDVRISKRTPPFCTNIGGGNIVMIA